MSLYLRFFFAKEQNHPTKSFNMYLRGVFGSETSEFIHPLLC